MKKLSYKTLMACGLTAVMACGMTSCSDDDDNNENNGSEAEALLQKANEQFVDATVIPTYHGLATSCVDLQETIEALADGSQSTDAAVVLACKQWKEARQYWEWSEAFLFGAASKYGIDPHIDTWPLDAVALENLLNSPKMMADIENTVANLNSGLVGFHGLEYIIFRNGESRKYADIPNDELRYAAAVAADLTLSAYRLEAAWAGLDNVSAEGQEILADAEAEPEDDFGEQMRLCGQAGSVWKTVTDGSVQILEGCRNIVDEVAHSKIGKPHSGEDVNYIESPHSYNSIQDFYDNICSVRHAYYGGLEATTPQEGSIAAYLAVAAPAVHQQVVTTLNASLKAIDSMERPFVLHYNSSEAKVTAAIEALETLDDALAAAQKVLN
jgi:hypothetical protein